MSDLTAQMTLTLQCSAWWCFTRRMWLFCLVNCKMATVSGYVTEFLIRIVRSSALAHGRHLNLHQGKEFHPQRIPPAVQFHPEQSVLPCLCVTLTLTGQMIRTVISNSAMTIIPP